MGGFTLGEQTLGIETIALSATHLHVIMREQISIAQFFKAVLMTQESSKNELRPPVFTLLTGGFPCQPYSRQGDLQGLRDTRGLILRYLASCVAPPDQRPVARMFGQCDKFLGNPRNSWLLCGSCQDVGC